MGVHWEGPAIGSPPPDRCDDLVRGIQNYHMNVRKWEDIAYSFMVCPHGMVFQGRGWGSRSAANGTEYGNTHFHAVCYLGGIGDPFTQVAKNAMCELINEGRRKYPSAFAIRPHSTFKSTDCPGNVIRSWLLSDPCRVVPYPVPTDPSTPYPEDNMIRHDLHSPLDADGNGYIDTAIPAVNIVSIVANGDDPSGPAGDVGYKPIPAFSKLAWGTGSRIVLRYGPKAGAVDFHVWEAATP